MIPLKRASVNWLRTNYKLLAHSWTFSQASTIPRKLLKNLHTLHTPTTSNKVTHISDLCRATRNTRALKPDHPCGITAGISNPASLISRHSCRSYTVQMSSTKTGHSQLNNTLYTACVHAAFLPVKQDRYRVTYQDSENPSRPRNSECIPGGDRRRGRAETVDARWSRRDPGSPSCNRRGHIPVRIGRRGHDTGGRRRGRDHVRTRRQSESQSAERSWFWCRDALHPSTSMQHADRRRNKVTGNTTTTFSFHPVRQFSMIITD